MKENKLVDLSMDLAVQVVKFCETVNGHYSLVNQLERSATSIGANIGKRITRTEKLILLQNYKLR